MTIALTLTAGSALSTNVSAPSIDWARGYSFSPSESHPHAGVELADGGFLMVGDGVDYTHRDPAVKRHWFAQKVTRRGDVEWQVCPANQLSCAVWNPEAGCE